MNNLITQASNYGRQSEQFNGMDVALNYRFGQGGTTLAPTTGPAGSRTSEDFCRLTNNNQTQVKFSSNYPLPWWGLQASAIYQNLPGISLVANRNTQNAEIAPSLGRNLSAGANANVNTSIIVPYTQFEDRVQQVDLRFSKRMQFGKARVTGQFDLYNVMNAGTIVSENGTFGPTWLRPDSILGPRLLRFGAQFDF